MTEISCFGSCSLSVKFLSLSTEAIETLFADCIDCVVIAGGAVVAAGSIFPTINTSTED